MTASVQGYSDDRDTRQFGFTPGGCLDVTTQSYDPPRCQPRMGIKLIRGIGGDSEMINYGIDHRSAQASPSVISADEAAIGLWTSGQGLHGKPRLQGPRHVGPVPTDTWIVDCPKPESISLWSFGQIARKDKDASSGTFTSYSHAKLRSDTSRLSIVMQGLIVAARQPKTHGQHSRQASTTLEGSAGILRTHAYTSLGAGSIRRLR
ncbi:hypothetical protein BKA70DRAFT_1236982 [Coprinopsis sp. MPI-PUGE-AT-0042]|nr:hypothetical protein BKA70DRAFT_1236982 [Coprinopsis sp. MPI-PUGE-AT-0042]